jgi:lipopolysaccharide/colanic/teichoic acid biosynthesis glycosyltransferase
MMTTTERRAHQHRTSWTEQSQPRRGRPHLVNQELFRGALIRERKRADRSNQPLGLMLIGLDDCLAAEPASTWNHVVEALAAGRRQTDVVGWFEHQAAVGVILAEIPGSDRSFVAELEARTRRELERRLDEAILNRLSVRLLVHPEPKVATDGMGSVDPLLTELRPRTSRELVNARLKRGLDCLGSGALLMLLAPLFLVIAALVKLTSRGPVFFKQVRVGEKAKPFTMLKFRSMRVNASAAIHQQYVASFINGGAAAATSATGPVFKLTNDPRITPIGGFLRKSSLDELPQLWNVFCGSMSLVGPRPPLQYEVDQYKAWHCRRVLEAKPGMTGLWQVAGRSRTTFDEMVRLDLRYARTCSLWNDLKILFLTPKAVIAGKGAC